MNDDESTLAGSEGADAPEPEAEAPKVEEAVEETAEAPKEVDGTDSEGEGQPPKPNRNTPAKERIRQLTAQRYEAERAAEDARKEAERLKERLKQYEKPAPKESDFDSYDEYQAALSAHQTRQYFKEDREADVSDAETRAKAAKEAADRVALETFNERATDFAARVPDYSQKVNDPTLPVSALMRDHILASDEGPAVAYYLATNRAEAARIAGLTSERDVARAIGRIEGRLTQPPPKKITSAPPPVKAVATGAGSQGDFNPARASVDDMAAYLKRRGVIG